LINPRRKQLKLRSKLKNIQSQTIPKRAQTPKVSLVKK
jgi:hypothetical protein